MSVDLAPAVLDDEDLVTLLDRAGRADLEAFAAFYDATHQLVWNLELRRWRDPALAESAARRRYRSAWQRSGEQRASGLGARAWLLSLPTTNHR